MTTTPMIAASIAAELTGTKITTDQIDGIIKSVARAMNSDQAGVKKRFNVLSTGERAVAAAILSRCDYSEQADKWSGGQFLQLLCRTSGAHLAAVLSLLNHEG
ncbi:hypothetical protein [Azospirillum argentinense]